MGLGKELLEELAKIGNEYDMQKIMLTVLKGMHKLLFRKTPLGNSSRKHKGDGVLQGYWVHCFFFFISYLKLFIRWLKDLNLILHPLNLWRTVKSSIQKKLN